MIRVSAPLILSRSPEVSFAHQEWQASAADVYSRLTEIEAVRADNTNARTLLRDTLQILDSNPEFLLDRWELEPLTPLSTPSQSPASSPQLSPLPHLCDMEEPLPVIDTTIVGARTPSRGPRPAPLPPHPGRTRAQAGKAVRRRNKRKADANPFERKLKSSTSDRVGGTGMLKSSMGATSLPIARGAYVGVRQDGIEKRYWTLDALRAEGFEIRKWDGR